MSVRTITIDLQAYGLLARHKKAGQSFSQVIKAHFAPQPTVKTLRATLATLRASDDALDAMEQQVRDRPKSPARALGR